MVGMAVADKADRTDTVDMVVGISLKDIKIDE